MSFYRTLLTTLAALVIASPVFADDEATTDASPAAVTTTTQTTTTESTTTETKVNINKATAKELMQVKGMNAAKARAIVAYRKKHGDFTTLDQLAKVKGFSKMKVDKMKEMQDGMTAE